MHFLVRHAALSVCALPTPQTISAVGFENLSCLVCKLQVTWIVVSDFGIGGEKQKLKEVKGTTSFFFSLSCKGSQLCVEPRIIDML